MVHGIHRILGHFEAFRERISRFLDTGWGIWLLVALLLVSVYFVAISKLTELIVGGF